MAKAIMDIRSAARTSTALALRTLRHIAAQKDAPASARVAAAQCLLDRGWGKAQQNHGVTEGAEEIRVTIRHMVEGVPDVQKTIDITPDPDPEIP